MMIVALDPGGTTGVVAFNPTLFKSDPAGYIPYIAHIGPEPHHMQLYDFLASVSPTAVVYESFEYRNRARAGLVLDSKEYIGVTKLYAEQFSESCKIAEQSASQAKGFIPDKGPMKDEAIKRLGWYFPGKKHGMDAVRHLIYYLVNSNRVSPDIRDLVLQRGFKPAPTLV